MRVLLISHTCQSATEGQPKAAALARLPGIDLSVLVPDRWFLYGKWQGVDPIPADAGYRLDVGKVRLPWAGPGQWYLHNYPQLTRLVREFQPDVIDAWEEPYGLVSVQACVARQRGCPTARVVTETEQNVNKRLPPPFEWFRSYTLRRADWAVGRSPEAVAVLRRKGYAGPATVVPNAVDADLFRPLDRAECRRKWAVDPAAFVVGYVGRLVPEKGVEDLAAAVAACPPNVQLLVAGDGPLRATLAASDRVRCVGPVPPRELPTFMNAIDVLALPSRTTPRWKEQFGRVLIEAHACGVPTIGSSSGAIPSVVGDGGLVVPERSPADLAAAIARLRSDPVVAAAMAAAGRSVVFDRYTWDRVAAQMRDVYEQVLAAPAR